MRWAWRRLLDWLCERIGLRLCFDGDLMAPSGDEDWWRDRDPQELAGRNLLDQLMDGGADGWPAAWVYDFLEADGWRWDGQQWEQDYALA